MEFTENVRNSPSSSVEFTKKKKRGIHGKNVELTEVAWNLRRSVGSAGVFLVMWGRCEPRPAPLHRPPLPPPWPSTARSGEWPAWFSFSFMDATPSPEGCIPTAGSPDVAAVLCERTQLGLTVGFTFCLSYFDFLMRIVRLRLVRLRTARLHVFGCLYVSSPPTFKKLSDFGRFRYLGLMLTIREFRFVHLYRRLLFQC